MKSLASLAVIAIAVVLLTGGIHLGNAVSHDQTTSDYVGSVWSQVHVGMAKWQVREILGNPDNTDHSVTKNYPSGVTRSDTWFYGTLASTSYSVDFINGIVDSKYSG